VLLDRLGIAEAIKQKAVMYNAGRNVVAAVAKGDAGDRNHIHPANSFRSKASRSSARCRRRLNSSTNIPPTFRPASAAAEPATALLAYPGTAVLARNFRAAGVVP